MNEAGQSKAVTLTSPPPEIAKEDIVVVAVMRNEMLRLQDFMRHYRTIGIDQFLIIDNGSDDGTAAYLSEQPDVTLFQTEQSYADSRCGVDWTNQVLHDWAEGHWVLVVDADELFVYPHYETTSLRQLTGYLDDQGCETMAAPMLDMYPLGPIRDAAYLAGDSLLKCCPYFDAGGYSVSQPIPGLNTLERGGPRERLFWEDQDRPFPSPYLNKYPLIKWRPDLDLEASTHILSGARVAPVSGLLLHFKFLQDYADLALSEVERAEHFAGARQYVAYNEVLGKDPGLTAYFEGSVKWRDSDYTRELGLMTVPNGYPFTKASLSCGQAKRSLGETMSSEIGHWKDFLVTEPSAKHLGGNLMHGDGLTITPRLWQALVDRFAPRTMLDVGAGQGHAAAYFGRAGLHAHGIDGLASNVDTAVFPIAQHDFVTGPYVYPCDLTYCVEVAEHVEETYVDNLLDTLTNAPVIVMTHAEPGQRGHHHVNLQPASYWIEKMEARGYAVSIDNPRFREVAAAEMSGSFFSRSGLIFLKRAASSNA
ncbi:glycosyltransferase family 2 protein [uncultured Litoreibacter sp.]|uniref:glycosyltransferase family 2 protein n=1 Tax=uncultured Litoreibacter sp. TaxID=1392394 RepID=UPI002619E816|nr:glycosyltransferase family 2 protein [uncultured Litoreibacter sp.]